MTGFYQDTVQDLLLDLVFGDSGTPPTPPGTFYVAIFTVMPDTLGNGGVEASWSGYARFSVANTPTEFPNAGGSPSQKANANAWSFGVAGSGPTDVLGFGFYDDPTLSLSANFWAAATLLGAPVTINNGSPVAFAPGSVVLSGCV